MRTRTKPWKIGSQNSFWMMQVKRIFFQKPQRIRFGQSIERWNNKKKSAKTNTILMLIPNKCPRRIEFNYFSHRSWEDVDYKWRTLSLLFFKQHLMAFFTIEWTCSEGWCQIPKFVAFPLLDAIVLNYLESKAKNINLTPVGLLLVEPNGERTRQPSPCGRLTKASLAPSPGETNWKRNLPILGGDN